MAGARRIVDIAIVAGLTFFDTANGDVNGLAEEILGQVLEGRRNQVLISTKATFGMGGGPNPFGSSRIHLLEQCHDNLQRTMVCSPLAGGALSGKIRRGAPPPNSSRLGQIDVIPSEEERLHQVVDVLTAISPSVGRPSRRWR